MEFWKKSSTAVKAAIIIAAALILILLIALIVNFSNQGSDSGNAPDGGGETPGEVVTVEPPPTVDLPTPEAGSPTVTATGIVNVRSGPGTNYPRIGLLTDGQTAEAIGRSADGAWWVVNFPVPPDNQGWIAAQYVTATDVDGLPIIQAPPLPEPTSAPPVPITDWRGEYYANANLAGEPTLVRNDESINFNWGSNPPAAGMPATNWSARWNINRNVPAGTYRFSAWVDDGLRIYVDNQLVLDGWQAGPARNYTVDVNVTAGAHEVRVEYFQGDGGALIQLDIGYIEGYSDWKAEYFNNIDLSGAAIVVRNEQSIAYDWGAAPPAAGIQADNWSARWTRTTYLQSGDYTFQVDVEGGVRLWVDERILIDSWNEQGSRTLQGDTGSLNAGDHVFRVEYFKASGNGHLTVTGKEADGDPIPPTAVIQGPTRADIGEEVFFSASGSSVAVGSHISTASWDFGDDATASGTSTSHIYQNPGLYHVTLTITDDKGLSDTTSQQIRIDAAEATPAPPQAPTAVIDAPAQAEVGASVTFYAGNSQSVSPILDYAWDFGDGTVADTVTAQKIYSTAGVYTVNLTIIDDQGLRSDAQHEIAIREAAQPTEEPTTSPTAQPTEPPVEPTTPPLETTEPPEETPEAPVEPTPEATTLPEVPGDGAVQLPETTIKVTAGGAPIPVTEVNGVPTIQVAADVTFQIDASTVAASNPGLTFAWDMGDGQPPLSGPVIEYSYSQSGAYSVTVTLDNGEESMDTVWQVIVQ